jgi:hypothetical protein
MLKFPRSQTPVRSCCAGIPVLSAVRPDPELNWHAGKEPLGWIKRGIVFNATGQDVSRVFLRTASRTEVIDPIDARKRAAP